MNTKSQNSSPVYHMVYGGSIAAIYVVLTLLLAPISFGAIQFRISEALCILPYFTPAAIPGLFIGCFLSNFLGAAAAPDIIFGSLATLIGALGSYGLRKWKYTVCIPPILSNIIIIPWVLQYAYGIPGGIPYLMLTIGIGEILAIGVLGNVLLTILDRYRYIIFSKHSI